MNLSEDFLDMVLDENRVLPSKLANTTRTTRFSPLHTWGLMYWAPFVRLNNHIVCTLNSSI